jgi:hypothetical protein
MNFVQRLRAMVACIMLAGCSGHGSHHDLYAAIQMYGTPLTISQADELINDITARVSADSGKVIQLSDRQAETVAVGFARGRIEPQRWADAASFAVVMLQTE